MVNSSSKTLTKQQLEAKIQEIEKDIESIDLELKTALDKGARSMRDRWREMSIIRLKGNPSPKQKQELQNEELKLLKDPLYVEYVAADVRMTHAKRELRKLMWALNRLEASGDPPTPLLEEISWPAAASQLPRSPAKSGSLNSSVSSPTSKWFKAFWRPDAKDKDKNA